ncbi:tellurite-like stress resistance cysteine protease StiP, partial [Acinetobacter baumannii]|nr:tellurite-like stress resistance cysteine protease StiP [Acinetobacter baumannii]
MQTGDNISSDLAVLADPARLSAIAGTRNDVCIPNACLNSTISGLVSRTILNRNLIGENDYHGA